MPAPPAPTITTSSVWVCMSGDCSVSGRPGGVGREGRCAGPPRGSALAEGGQQARLGADRARVEGEDHQRAQDDRDDHGEVEQSLEDQAETVAARVVVDDRAHAVAAVDEPQPQHQQVPDLPEGGGPFPADEGEVDALDALAQPQVHEEVAEDEDHQQQAGGAHEQPREHLGVDAALARAAVAGARIGDGGGGHRDHAPNMCMRWRGRKPAMRTTHTITTPQNRERWRLVPWDQKSTRITRTPLRAWKRTAPTRPTSPRPNTTVL